VTTADDQPLLPDVTSDESASGWGDDPEPDDVQRLLDERPPHHEDRD
jgi:hypothetical protein